MAAAAALVPFDTTKELLFEDAYTCHLYAFDRQRQFERFKRAATHFVGYLIHYKTVDRLFVQYRIYWLVFVSRVLQTHGHRHEPVTDDNMSVDQFTALTLSDVYSRFQLDPYTFSPDDGYKNVWGNRYWEFLHTLTLCIDRNVPLIRAFANLMLNFHLVLVCGACYNNYRRKDPLRTVTVPIRETLDPITVTYNLHNAVNAETGNAQFALAEFCDRYECKLVDTYTHNYRTIVHY